MREWNLGEIEVDETLEGHKRGDFEVHPPNLL